MGGVLAIDLGEKKTGFAVTDAVRIIRQPLEPAWHPDSSHELVEHIAGLLDERDIDTLLVGLPLSPTGDLGARARATLEFVDRLRKRFPERDVHTLDEHLTTKEAESRLREAGYRGRELKARRDSFSALVLLEEWLGGATG